MFLKEKSKLIGRLFCAIKAIFVSLGVGHIFARFHSVGNVPCCKERSSGYFTGLAIGGAADSNNWLPIRSRPGDLLSRRKI